MNKKITNKTRAIILGILIIVAYGVLASAISQNKIVVMVADVISGLAVIFIAVLMFPLFKKSNKKVSVGYLILKSIEGLLMTIGGILFLNSSLQYMRGIVYERFHIWAFVISGFMFYYLLYKTKLVPRFISIWGATGIFVLLVSTILGLINIHYVFIDYLLVIIITNEVFLSIWLFVKGFDKSAINR